MSATYIWVGFGGKFLEVDFLGILTFYWVHGMYPVVNYEFLSVLIGFRMVYLAIIPLYFGLLLWNADLSSDIWVGMGGNEFFGILLGPQDMPNNEL